MGWDRWLQASVPASEMITTTGEYIRARANNNFALGGDLRNHKSTSNPCDIVSVPDYSRMVEYSAVRE